MTSYANIPERCLVYLDGQELTDPSNPTGLTPTSPLTIRWGTNYPWDEPAAAVLSIAFVDHAGDYTRNAQALVGQRITVRAAWTNPYPQWSIFDGFITKVDITANETPYHISVQAADRMKNLLDDKRMGPNSGVEAKYCKGYQWWINGSQDPTLQRFTESGITEKILYNAGYNTPYLATEQVSVIDVIYTSFPTSAGTNKYKIDVAQPFYVSTDRVAPAVIRRNGIVYMSRMTLTGATIYTADGTNAYQDANVVDAADLTIDDNATLTSDHEYYTQAEFRYSHRTLTNANATDEQRAKEDTYYQFRRDGSRSVRVDPPTRQGENVLTLDIQWTETPQESLSKFEGVDLTPTVRTLQESNRRTRLPAVTAHSCDRGVHILYRPEPQLWLILGSKYESTVPTTHGPWISLSGTLTYDATGYRRRDPETGRVTIGHWKHEMNLWPAVPDITTEPPLSDLTKCTDATFADADWKLGALRYVTDCARTR